AYIQRMTGFSGSCSNKDCSFLHVKPAPKTQSCPWYDQGFCKDGPLCKYRHVHQAMCPDYFTGFCPKGPKCQLGHPKMSAALHPRIVKAKPMVYHQKRWTLPPACSSRAQPAP
uniref:Cleavage and polyadenylation specificity factor subunit 4 n=1 Tax=Peromyscus maniculatus bairdii TaxID=230844 RepID=A0A8C8TFA2_PERMB